MLSVFRFSTQFILGDEVSLFGKEFAINFVSRIGIKIYD